MIADPAPMTEGDFDRWMESAYFPMLSDCGFVLYNENQNRVKWRKYARRCVGDEIYEKFVKSV